MKSESFVHHGVGYFAKNLGIAVGLVLIWRGMWYVLDALDLMFLGGNHLWSALVGIVVGVLILYVPDRDLKELAKL